MYKDPRSYPKIDPTGTTKKVQSTPGNGSTRVRRRRMQGDLIKISAAAEWGEMADFGVTWIALVMYHGVVMIALNEVWRERGRGGRRST